MRPPATTAEPYRRVETLVSVSPISPLPCLRRGRPRVSAPAGETPRRGWASATGTGRCATPGTPGGDAWIAAGHLTAGLAGGSTLVSTEVGGDLRITVCPDQPLCRRFTFGRFSWRARRVIGDRHTCVASSEAATGPPQQAPLPETPSVREGDRTLRIRRTRDRLDGCRVVSRWPITAANSQQWNGLALGVSLVVLVIVVTVVAVAHPRRKTSAVCGW